MRNIEVAIALLFGYFIAWLTRHHGKKYVTNANIDVSDNITFLWRHWFGIGFYSPALLRASPSASRGLMSGRARTSCLGHRSLLGSAQQMQACPTGSAMKDNG